MVEAFVFSIDELFFFLGMSLTIGYGLSFLLEKYGVPNVVVYLSTGFVIANLFFEPELIRNDQFQFWFLFIETLALGLIGFKIGVEMEIRLLREHSRVISILILFEVFGAFFLVFIVAFFYSGIFLLALILGGLATATAPAATIEVIRRLNAKGPMTQKLKWILAFDDVAAVVVVEGILSYLLIIALDEPLTLQNYLLEIWQEIGIALFIGIFSGYVIDLVIERLEHTFQIMEFTFASLILVMGLAHTLKTSVILACMMVGAVTVNRKGNNFARAETHMDMLLSPILIIFFLLVGAQVHISDFYDPFPVLAFLYLVARSLGKYVGIYFGGAVSGSDEKTKKYLGMGLLPQGGVALGLTSIAVEILEEAGLHEIASRILVTIVVSTFLSEGLGAISAGYALRAANEA